MGKSCGLLVSMRWTICHPEWPETASQRFYALEAAVVVAHLAIQEGTSVVECLPYVETVYAFTDQTMAVCLTKVQPLTGRELNLQATTFTAAKTLPMPYLTPRDNVQDGRQNLPSHDAEDAL